MNIIKALFSRLSDSLLRPFRGDSIQLPSLPLLLRFDWFRQTGCPAFIGFFRCSPTHRPCRQPARCRDDAIRRSQSWFFNRHMPVLVAELEADTTLTSEYLMLRRFLDRVDPEREEKAVRYLQATQLPDGGGRSIMEAPEISASVGHTLRSN